MKPWILGGISGICMSSQLIIHSFLLGHITKSLIAKQTKPEMWSLFSVKGPGTPIVSGIF